MHRLSQPSPFYHPHSSGFRVQIIKLLIPKRVLYTNKESTRPRGRTRNGWQDEAREDGRIVDGEEWQKELYNREQWKKFS
jgi:hypothetical protein